MKSCICGIYYHKIQPMFSRNSGGYRFSFHSCDCKTRLTCLTLESNMSSSIERLVPLLDGSNYRVWADSMKPYLMSQGYWRIANGDFTKPPSINLSNKRYADVEGDRRDWDNKDDA